MAERVECVAATSPLSVVYPGEPHPDGTTSGPNYGVVIHSGSGAVVVVEGPPAELVRLVADLALVVAGVAVHAGL
jgi:hypothetical protein